MEEGLEACRAFGGTRQRPRSQRPRVRGGSQQRGRRREGWLYYQLVYSLLQAQAAGKNGTARTAQIASCKHLPALSHHVQMPSTTKSSLVRVQMPSPTRSSLVGWMACR